MDIKDIKSRESIVLVIPKEDTTDVQTYGLEAMEVFSQKQFDERLARGAFEDDTVAIFCTVTKTPQVIKKANILKSI